MPASSHSSWLSTNSVKALKASLYNKTVKNRQLKNVYTVYKRTELFKWLAVHSVNLSSPSRRNTITATSSPEGWVHSEWHCQMHQNSWIAHRFQIFIAVSISRSLYWLVIMSVSVTRLKIKEKLKARLPPAHNRVVSWWSSEVVSYCLMGFRRWSEERLARQLNTHANTLLR